MPIQVSLDWVNDIQDEDINPCDTLHNVSLGGLAFKSPRGLPIGQLVSVKFPQLNKNIKLSARVIWDKKDESGFKIGLEFNNPHELYRLRLIEQICHIEHYRLEIEHHEKRHLSSEEAVREWISQYAKHFPEHKK